MTVPYHYIVAGLPDIVFDPEKIDIGLNEFIAEIGELIPETDARWLRYVGYPVDNVNLARLRLGKNEPITRIGNFNEAELREEIKNPDRLPDYMREFLAAHNDNLNIVPNLSWENQLHWLFHEKATTLDNRFLREWFTFELDLRNVLTAIQCRKTKQALEDHLICRNEVTQLLFKSNAPDFNLPSKISWADDVLAIDFDNIAQSEEKLARLALERLEDMAEPDPFGVETVMRVGIGLSLTERWNLLDDKTGKEMLDQIINDLEASYQTE